MGVEKREKGWVWRNGDRDGCGETGKGVRVDKRGKGYVWVSGTGGGKKRCETGEKHWWDSIRKYQSRRNKANELEKVINGRGGGRG